MASINIDKMSLKDLIAHKADVEQAITTARQRERQEILQKMEALAEESGFSINDLLGGKGRGKGKMSQSAARYVNPDNKTQTWTGRGRKPNWLVAKLNKGSKLDDFAL
ncbi:MAG: H-NS histone family protein [Hyphomicrobiaceae bacterium]|nr:H-NS histone family protein [Hyphomicrobiaceae bacterium]